MSGYDSASTESLQQRLADTEETLAALRESQARMQERYDRTEHRHADSNLWQLQEDIERFETRRDMCLAALRKKD